MEALEEANSRRKNQCSRKGKGQGAEVDLPFVLIIRPKKTQQEQDCCRCSRDSQNNQERAERRNSASKTDGNDGEKRRQVEERERGSTAVG